ncbi:MAG: DUF2071 domain-containing protein [Planctomycetota bacterium]|nr:DUF2071 domain-containing protein [Planctomycetota bacterium]
MSTARETLTERLAPKPAGWMDIATDLRHFALITYAIPEARLRPHVHERFEIETFEIDGMELALLSVVPFEDAGFHFIKAPLFRFHFCQTNYRIYVKDKITGERVVWFLGTTLGSWTVNLCRSLWGIPWHRAHYRQLHDWNATTDRYDTFRYEVQSKWAPATIGLRDTGEDIPIAPGFECRDEMMLCLTQPLQGFYHRLNGKLGGYSVGHDLLQLRRAEPVELHFGLLERLGLQSAAEMQVPHSAWICPKTRFHIFMPPLRFE